MISLRAQLIRQVTGAYFRTVDAKTADVQAMRRRWHSWANVLGTARGVTVETCDMRGLNAEWLTPKDAAEGKLLLYLHGGAYIMGSCNTHRELASHIAHTTGVRTLLPEYGLAPEHPFPAAIDDAVSVYRALLAEGYAAEDIVIAGDSAGGGLTVATLMSLRDANEPLPAAACLLSPWLDLTASGDSMKTRAHKDPWFKPKYIPVVRDYYVAKSQARHPLASPVFGDLSGLPPLLIQVGEDEILLSDSIRCAEQVEAAGGDIELEIWPGMWHVFQVFVHRMPESRAAIQKIGEFIRCVLKVEELSET